MVYRPLFCACEMAVLSNMSELMCGIIFYPYINKHNALSILIVFTWLNHQSGKRFYDNADCCPSQDSKVATAECRCLPVRYKA